MNARALKRQKGQATTPVRDIARRLYNERRNPPHLQANLDRVVHRSMELLKQQSGYGTTYDSVVISLLYLAQGSYLGEDMERAITHAINGR